MSVGPILTLVSCLFCILLLFLRWFIRRHFSYWSRRGFPEIKPIPVLGNFELKQELPGIAYERMYNELKRNGHKYGGVYTFFRRSFMPVDQELYKRIFVKDFEHFARNKFFHHPNDILSQQLLTMKGERWKSMRSSLTPAFSTGKIKYMFDTTIIAKGKILNEQAKKLAASTNPIDIRDFTARYTTDVITSSALGVECDSMREPDSIFRHVNKDLTKVHPFWSVIQFLILEHMIPYSILGALGHKLWGNKKTRRFFMDMVKQSAEARIKESTQRNDFFQVLLEIRKKDFDSTNSEKGMTSSEGLTQKQIAAQSYIFFFGGYETTSTTFTFVLLNMALYPELQQKCREEVKEVLSQHSDKVSYEAVQKMPFLDQFLQESLRLYPPFLMWDRECTKEYRIAGTDHVIEKDTHVIIPIRAVHMDPDIYPNPEIFDPERFSYENKQKRSEQTFLAFGGGPRQCIGQRFAYVNLKSAIANIIKDLRVKLNPKTQIPIELDPTHFVTVAKGGVWLNFELLED